MIRTCAVVSILTAAAAPAHADGYCDFVEGVADAQSDLLYAPQLFGTIGYVKEPIGAGAAALEAGARAQAGIDYKISGLWEASATREHGRVDCRRHQALDRVQGESMYAALEEKAKILAEVGKEADKILAHEMEELSARRTTSTEIVAIRLRVNELRELAADTRRQLAALPPQQPGEKLGGALGAYYAADDELEHLEGRLRKLQGIDVSVRFGYDQYLDRADNAPVFALLTVGVNLGVLFMGSANDRAAAGRRVLTREQHHIQLVDTTITHLKSIIETESARADETAALMKDLETQMANLDRVGGDENRRARQTVWFDWAKVKADHAFLVTHVASLREVVGEVGGH
jgi:hypothetical protein